MAKEHRTPLCSDVLPLPSRGLPRPRLSAPLLIVLALGAALPALPAQGRAPRSDERAQGHRRPRAIVAGVLGALLGGAAGFAFSKGGKQSGGQLIAVGTVGGGLAGFLIGRQFDQRYAATFRGTPQLRIPNITAELEGDPSVLAVSDSEAAVGGSTGVQLFTTLESELLPLGRRAMGLRGIDAVGMAPSTGWLALGTRAGLYVYPPVRGPGVLVRRATVTAIAAAEGRIFASLDNRIESVPVVADSARSWPGVTLAAPVRDLALDEARAVLWASTDRQLVALRITGDSLLPMGAAPLASAGLRMKLQGTLAAVAMGNEGVALFDVSDPAHPLARGAWTGARFAYDVSLDGSRLFVAAGPEGVYVVDLSGPAPRTIGLARSLGFASAIASHDGRTFILDRRTNLLRRITSAY
jgi:hypothetical protein